MSKITEAISYEDLKKIKAEKFESKTNEMLNVVWKNVKIPRSRLSTDGFACGINHRPKRENHIKKMKATIVSSDIERFPVMYNSETENFVLMDGQHFFEAYCQKIDDGDIEPPEKNKFLCKLAYNPNTDEMLDVQNDNDTILSKNYSFCKNDGQEKPCVVDKIYQIYDLG